MELATGTIYDLLSAADPQRTLLVDASSGQELTYGQTREQAQALAGWLHDRGVRPGDRVAIQLRKGFEEVAAMLACVRLGAAFVNLHPLWKPERVLQVLDDAMVAAAVVEAAAVPHIVDAVELVVCVAPDAAPGTTSFADVVAADLAPPTGAVDASGLATLLYTSGSTGKAKGVMHSHANLVQFADNVAQYLGNHSEDRLLSVLPFSFGYGLSQLLTMLRVGGRLVLQRSPFAADIVAALAAHRITGFAGVASVWSQVVGVLSEQEQVPALGLRYITNAGGKLPSALADQLRTLLPDTALVLMYGSTEALRTTYVPPEQYERKKGAIGWATPGVQAFVVTDAGGLAGPGERGELVHVGDHTMMGYWQDEEATDSKLRPCPALAHLIGDRPVLFTEDLAKVDEDGCLWFESRASWMVKSAGFRFSLTEVEEAAERTDFVHGAIAFAVDDAEQGQAVEIIAATVDAAPEDGKALMRALRRVLPRYMLPKRVHPWRGALPLTANGKLDRHAAMSALGLASAGLPQDGV